MPTCCRPPVDGSSSPGWASAAWRPGGIPAAADRQLPGGERAGQQPARSGGVVLRVLQPGAAGHGGRRQRGHHGADRPALLAQPGVPGGLEPRPGDHVPVAHDLAGRADAAVRRPGPQGNPSTPRSCTGRSPTVWRRWLRPGRPTSTAPTCGWTRPGGPSWLAATRDAADSSRWSSGSSPLYVDVSNRPVLTSAPSTIAHNQPFTAQVQLAAGTTRKHLRVSAS